MSSATRIGDHERDRAIDHLSDLFVAGVLSTAELEQRVGLALRARTSGQLAALVEDCPPRRGRGPGGRIRGLQYAVSAAAAAVILGVAGAATGAIGPGDVPPPPPCGSSAADEAPTCLMAEHG